MPFSTNFTGPPMYSQSAADPGLAGSGSSGSSSPSSPCLSGPEGKHHRGWREHVRDFTPSWFSVIMGTGVVSILLHNLPYNGSWLYYISIIMFVLNVFLFVVFTVITVLRYTLYPETWSTMIRHPVQSLFLGTFPVGLATIINMIIFACVPSWGYSAVVLAWTLWWIDAVIAMMVTFFVPFTIMMNPETNLNTMTAAWLLPIISTIVASASGAIVASALPNPNHALWTITVSYILWGAGVPLAMVVLVIYFHRLTVHKLPPREVIVSVFLPLGPLGQGGFAIQELGMVALQIFPHTHTLPSADSVRVGEVFYVVGWLTAIIIWGFGLAWLFFAIVSISRMKFPFNMGWWGFTFPLGVFALSTLQLSKEMPSPVLEVLGTVFSVAVTLLWIMVATATLKNAVSGELFHAPCLKALDESAVEQDSVRSRQDEARSTGTAV